MPSSFSAPGSADDLNPGLLSRWNAVSDAEFDHAEKEQGSKHFAVHSTNPTALRHAVPRFGNPTEPEFCFDQTAARTLSDRGVHGRRSLHNEYCEYAVVTDPGSKSRMCPKRVHVTTELLAEDDPGLLRETRTETLGPPRRQELYGPAAANPKLLMPAQRRVAFARQTTGHGKHTGLATAGVPGAPGGSLNAVNTVFTAHPINELEALIYIVMFGAKPYAGRAATGELEAAGRDQVFRQESDREQPAYRNADPRRCPGRRWRGLQRADGLLRRPARGLHSRDSPPRSSCSMAAPGPSAAPTSVFLRLAADLGGRHLLPRAQQEPLVARDKLTSEQA
jgi:hypothetical protein